jgi:hypothetical protein
VILALGASDALSGLNKVETDTNGRQHGVERIDLGGARGPLRHEPRRSLLGPPLSDPFSSVRSVSVRFPMQLQLPLLLLFRWNERLADAAKHRFKARRYAPLLITD